MKAKKENLSIEVNCRVEASLFQLLEHTSATTKLSFSHIIRRSIALSCNELLRDSDGKYKEFAKLKTFDNEAIINDKIITMKQRKTFLPQIMRRNLIKMYKAFAPLENLITFLQDVNYKAINLNCSVAEKEPIENMLKLATEKPQDFIKHLDSLTGAEDKERREDTLKFLQNLRGGSK